MCLLFQTARDISSNRRDIPSSNYANNIPTSDLASDIVTQVE